MLNTQQQLAVDSNSKRILCLAGAGTGKTHTMLSRVSRLVSEGVNTHDIIVLTFTNAAAFEMGERYKLDHKNRLVPSFSTFHAFCYRLISNDIDILEHLGYTDIPSMPDDAKLKQVDTSIRQQCGIQLSKDKIQGKKGLTPKEKFQFDLYWKKFKQTLIQKNMITFDIMCYDVCKLFTENNPIIQKYKDQYKYIFVDEFQDTDPHQWDFVSSFDDASLFVVGDVSQAIYGFRGADSSIIKSLSVNEEWETIRLIENYRSTKQICDFANRINVDGCDAYRLNLESARDGENVVILDSPEISYMGNSVESGLQSVISDIISSESNSVAILVRTNAEVSSIRSIFDGMGVNYNSNNSGQHNIKILNSVLDNEYMLGWLSTKLKAEKYVEWVKLCTCDEKYKSFDEFYKLYQYEPYIHDILRIVSAIRIILRDDKLLPYQKCFEIVRELGLSNVLVNTTASKPREIVEYLIELLSESVDSNIYIGTIHSVKGLEYDEVHLLGVGGRSFPLSTEEQRNLYYVGVTRARSLLYVYKV